MGGYRDKLRDVAAAKLEKGTAEVKRIAAEGYQAVTEAARQASREGTLTDNVRDVVRSAAESTENAVRQRLANYKQSREEGAGQKPRAGKPKSLGGLERLDIDPEKTRVAMELGTELRAGLSHRCGTLPFVASLPLRDIRHELCPGKLIPSVEEIHA
ncbi:hypothetical protein [Mesorhizobium sp. WSM3626]|uniref:hypothetical protein n=1 Tax=Mesorhizobium sp. WSM3626 TaxID=1040987 RepID=UPI00047FB702|nr:hypothetical protein [Mesorhizobium sp. WSM3626]